MARISDQFEIEPAAAYSGSYTDPVFSPGTFFDENKFVVYSNANPNINAREFPNGFSLPRVQDLAVIFGKGFRLGRYDLELPSFSPVPNYSSSLMSEEQIASPSQNLLLKQFSDNEQFADTVMPRPPDICLANGANFCEGFSEFVYPGGFYIRLDSSFNLTGSSAVVSRQPKKFVITLGGGGSASLTSSSDASQISDNTWAYAYPFEGKYANIDRLLKPTFDKTYTITKEQGLESRGVGTSLQHQGAVDLFAQDHRHTSYQSNEYTLQFCFQTTGDEFFRDDIPYANKRRYVKLVNTLTETSGGIFKPTGSLQYPDLNFIYKGFFGFYKKNNDGTTPYKRSLENERDKPFDTSVFPVSLSLMADLRFNGFGTTDPRGALMNRAGFPVYDSCMGYTSYGLVSASFGRFLHYMAVEDFNSVFLRINGWKYGIYDALPRNSFGFWRRSRFGHFRDMLEQRVFTKYYDVSTGQALRAALEVSFVSGTLASVTASNVLFNSNSSGIYDIEGKSGKPFIDRDNED